MNSSYKKFVSLFLFSFFLCSFQTVAQQLEQIGGPYTNDANTIMLLHFDGNLNNESPLSDAAVLHKKGVSNQTGFFPSDIAGMGQCLYFDNDSKSDSSYVTVADNVNLDLTGDWTIEGWMQVYTFGDVAGDYRWVPRLCIKTGDQVFYQPNWWVELWGDNRCFQTGFQETTQSYWPSVTSANNVMEPGKWVHLTFIRDNTREILAQLVHNDKKELIWFGTMSYAGLDNKVPLNTNQAVHIGWAGAEGIPESSNDSWLHGFVDEVRISNVVRNFPVPPVFTYLNQLSNKDASVASYEIKTSVFAFQTTGTMSEVTLKYTIDNGATWNNIAMTKAVGDTFVASIPKQAAGSVIRYYVVGKDNNGLEAQYPSTGVSPYSFGIYQPVSKILDLDFEEGSGAIVDKGVYNQKVDVHGNGGYSTDAKVGTYSYDFPVGQDSSYLSVDSPFLTTKDFAIDYWFKAEGDTVLPYIRMIIRSASNNHVDQNYYVRVEPGNQLSARYQVDPSVDTRTKSDIALISQTDVFSLNKWVHILFERDDTAAVFEIRGENDQLVERMVDLETAANPPRPGTSPLRIGWAANSWDNVPRNFMGKIDGIKIYNYAALNLPHTPATAVEDNAKEVIPVKYQLSQNYPNPFNPETVISYSLPNPGVVKVEIYDILGKKVKTLVNEFKNAGKYDVRWNGRNEYGSGVPSGIYFYRLQTGDFVQTMKMTLLR